MIVLFDLKSFADRKVHLDNLNIYFQDFMKIVTSIHTIATHSIIYKCYIIASNVVFKLSSFLHSRVNYTKKKQNFYSRLFLCSNLKGRSDTMFAKIVDKMVLPLGIIKSNLSSNAKITNLAIINNQNSILISLKDTLHLVNFSNYLKNYPIIHSTQQKLEF